jgi:hypothetical protein
MNEPGLAAVCGTSCGNCRFHPATCAGCHAVSGKPFWVKEYGREVCRLYDCAVNQKGITHCGECAELPCTLFMESSDPALSPEQAEASRNKRIAKLKNRLEIQIGNDNS